MQENLVRFLGWEDTLERARITTPVFMGLLGGSDSKESACNVGDLGLIPGLGRSPGGGKGYPFQHSGLENSMDCIVHGVTKSQTGLRYFQKKKKALRYLTSLCLEKGCETERTIKKQKTIKIDVFRRTKTEICDRQQERF